MRRLSHYQSFTNVILAFFDMLWLNLANVVAFWIRFAGHPPSYNLNAYFRILPWEMGGLVLVFYVYGLYSPKRQTSQEVRSATTSGIIVTSLITLALTFLLMNIGLPRSVFILSAIIQIPLFMTWRLLYRSYVLRTAPATNVLIVGPKTEWDDLSRAAGKFLPRISLQYYLPQSPYREDLFRDVGAILLGTMGDKDRETYFHVASVKNIPCFWNPSSYDLLVSQASLTALGERPMYSLALVTPSSGSALFKRLADIAVSILGLIMGFPLLALIGLVVLLDSGFPVLYWQERVTIGGHPFNLVKFRTMIPNAEVHSGPVLAQAHDPRITRIGGFLRATHLDELPQLWNILRGDMSLVGPRPERPGFVEQFKKDIPHYDLRHATTPGLTGLAQVSGTYSSSASEKTVFDIHYAKNRSWLSDLVIIVRTILQLKNKKD